MIENNKRKDTKLQNNENQINKLTEENENLKKIVGDINNMNNIEEIRNLKQSNKNDDNKKELEIKKIKEDYKKLEEKNINLNITISNLGREIINKEKEYNKKKNK